MYIPSLRWKSGQNLAAAADSLVVEILPLAVDLVLQGEVKGDVFHLLLDEDLGARGVLLLLQVFDHVGEPHGQTIVAAGWRGRRKRTRGRSRVSALLWLKRPADTQRCLRRRLISGATINLTVPCTVTKKRLQNLLHEHKFLQSSCFSVCFRSFLSVCLKL